jgi:response regulator RpfG family c-di-GMP phosphodiesterase
MEPTDATVEILKSVRDEVHSTNERLEGLVDEVQGLRADTVQRFDETNDRLGRLERRQTEAEVRVSTELVAVVGAVREVRDVLRADHVLRDRVDDH